MQAKLLPGAQLSLTAITREASQVVNLVIIMVTIMTINSIMLTIFFHLITIILNILLLLIIIIIIMTCSLALLTQSECAIVRQHLKHLAPNILLLVL